MSRSILNTQGVYINTVQAGSAIALGSESTAQTINFKPSKQGAVTSIADTDIFALEQADGSIRKISGQDLKNSSEQTTAQLPLEMDGKKVTMKGLSSLGTANQYMKMNSSGSGVEFATPEYITKGDISATSPISYNNTTGAFTLDTVPASKGGTGETSYTDGQIMIGKSIGNTLVKSTILNGTNTTVVNGSGSIKIELNTDILTPITFDSTLTCDNLIDIKASASSGGARFYEKSGPGYVLLQAPENIALGTTYTNTLPNRTGIVLVDDSLVEGSNVSIAKSNGICTISSSYVDTTYTAGLNLDLVGTEFRLKTTLVGGLTFNDTPTINSDVRINGSTGNTGFISLFDVAGDNYIKITPPDVLTNDFTLTCPTNSGTILTTASTITSQTLTSCTGNISQWTNNANFINSTDLTTLTNFGGSSSGDVTIGNDSIIIAPLVKVQPSNDLTTGNLIAYDNSLGTPNGSMIFGNNLTGTQTGWDTAIYAKQLITMKCGTTQVARFNVPPSGDSEIELVAKVTINDDLEMLGDNIDIPQDGKIRNASDTTNDWIQLKDDRFYSNCQFNEMHKLIIGQNKNDGYVNFYYYDTDSVGGLYMEQSGSARLYWNGNTVTTAGTWADISDSRVKLNQSKADNSVLAKCFDGIDVYTYNYTPQYAAENGKNPANKVYGWIAQEVIKETQKASSQFGTVCKNRQSFPNGNVDFHGERQVIDDLNTICKKDLILILWCKIKEQQKEIDELRTLVNSITR